MMEACCIFAKGINRDDLYTVVQMMRDLGDESHFLGSDYTREHVPFIPHLQDNENHDAWAADGRKDGFTRGLEAGRALLRRYDEIEPLLDPAIDEALRAFIQKREASQRSSALQ
jgi:trimethylamine--corrinoid protein Co-methyltransferase